jgi:hypothetical protein
MGGMRRAVLISAALGVLVLAATAAAQPSRPTGGVTGRAVVLVDTPDLPTGSGVAARSHWHRLRAESSRILGRVAVRDGLVVETAIPEIGLLSVDLGPGGLPALRSRLEGDP